MLKLYPGNSPLLVIAVMLPCFVFAQPIISSVSPHSGPVNSAVTLSGSGFSASPAANIVWFGSVKAPVTTASTGSLTVTVPAGASFGPITITTGGLTSSPAQPFISTFPDPGQFKPNTFTTRTDINTGLGPQSIFSMDLDGDGKPDLIIADGDSNIITVYHNNSTPGSISFIPQGSYIMDADDYPIGITAGDLDGDGKPEIIVSNYFSETLSIFRNTSVTGSISLAAPISYPLGNYCLAASVADLNGDGKPEIIVASTGDNLLSVFANNSTPGTLAFSPRVDWQLPAGSAPFKVAVADLDGDGKPDMAAANGGTNTVSIFRNTSILGGAISFAANVDFPTGSYPQGLAIGDLDGDGKPDLAIANNNDNTVSLLRNTSSSGTISFAARMDTPTGSGAYDLVISDFDGDGRPDIAVDDQYGGTVSVHHNTSATGTISISSNLDYPTGNVPFSLTTADFDGDGMPDLATANNTDATISILLNKGSTQPALTFFTPNVGMTGTIVTITGVNLTGITGVSFGDSAASSFTVLSPTTISATVGGGATGAVAVTTSAGVVSLPGFTYGVPPSITSFSPDSGASGATILIKGASFTGTSSILFGGTPAFSFTVLSDTVISAIVGTGSSGSVSLSAPAGTASLGGFSYISTPAPPVKLLTFSPVNAAAGANITITGIHLSGITSVSFGGTPVSAFYIITDSLVYATLGNGSSGDLMVNGTNGADSLAGFVYLAPPPPPPPPAIVRISAFSPTSGTTGTTVTISGHQLTGVNAVSFGGIPATTFNVLSDSVVLAVVGAGATGEVAIANPSSADSMSGFVYTYDSTRQAAPAVFHLFEFSGAFSGNEPLLQWQTANDAGIAYYALERALTGDTTQFSVIATLSPSGVNPGNHSYSFADPGYNQGVNYYRLRIQDTTAYFTYSPTISVQPAGKSSILNLYPNPVKYGFTYVTLPEATTATWFRLTDGSGRPIRTQLVAANISQVRVDLSGVVPGVYALTWSDGTHTAYQIILVLRP